MSSQNFTSLSGLPCSNYTSWHHLIYLPQSSIDGIVARCPNICQFVHGPGNPDLAGVGVVPSYIMELALAILFGPLLHFCSHILPAFGSSHDLKHFTTWLKHHQQLSLWSQLLFSFSLALACFIQEYQREVAAYDSSVIQEVVGVSLTSVLITTTAFYQRIERPSLFCFGLITIIVFTALAAFGPLIRGHSADPILQACINVSKDEKLPWGNGGVRPYKFPEFYARVVPYIGLTLILICMWLYLRLRRDHWTKTHEEFNYTHPAVKVLLVMIFLVSTALAGFGCTDIRQIFRDETCTGKGMEWRYWRRYMGSWSGVCLVCVDATVDRAWLLHTENGGVHPHKKRE
ncbi:hypothetical protein BKA64DRAFT_680133 [Cadophora sp. MPI-SDFR-AT-0126]|nr:hypothetical protein BKA64DRAFT_680133 [Leotiomycetes sp. MPI-SDFR-AT-0126]